MFATLLLASLVPMGATAGQSAPEARRPVAFTADARVELDASGKPTRIEASKDLPAAIRAEIERRVAAYTYSAPQRDGLSGPAVTYLSLGACAIPGADGGYRLGVDFKGNGPRVATSGRVPMPNLGLLHNHRVNMSMKVEFFIEPDGSHLRQAGVRRRRFAPP